MKSDTSSPMPLAYPQPDPLHHHVRKDQDKIQLLAEDSGLGDRIPAERLPAARAASVARTARIPTGPWQPPLLDGDPAALGLQMLDGFVSLAIEVHGRSTLEVLGPGDLLRPWVSRDPASVLGTRVVWWVHVPARFAVLDGDFARRMAPYPELTAELLHRSTMRARRLGLQSAINRHPTVRERLLLTMWDLADRWGRVTTEGIRIPLRLRHHHLAAAVCAQRPSVSKALSELQRRGLLDAARDAWVLHGDPPEEYAELRRQALV